MAYSNGPVYVWPPFLGFIAYDVVPKIAKNVCIWGRHHRTKVYPGVTMSYFCARSAQKYDIATPGKLLCDGDAPKCKHFWHAAVWRIMFRRMSWVASAP